MRPTRIATRTRGAKNRRRGVAAVEFAVCLPLVFLLLAGLWEAGRITEVQQIMWNSARETSRNASLGQTTLSSNASSLLAYLQSAEPTAFPPSHQTNMIAPVVALGANTTGYTCWDATANRELFTLTFTDMTNPSVTDPTAMSQLDRYEISVQVPYASIGWTPVARVTGITRLYVTMDWVSMVDSPFQIIPDLPAK